MKNHPIIKSMVQEKIRSMRNLEIGGPLEELHDKIDSNYLIPVTKEAEEWKKYKDTFAVSRGRVQLPKELWRAKAHGTHKLKTDKVQLRVGYGSLPPELGNGFEEKWESLLEAGLTLMRRQTPLIIYILCTALITALLGLLVINAGLK